MLRRLSEMNETAAAIARARVRIREFVESRESQRLEPLRPRQIVEQTAEPGYYGAYQAAMTSLLAQDVLRADEHWNITVNKIIPS